VVAAAAARDHKPVREGVISARSEVSRPAVVRLDRKNGRRVRSRSLRSRSFICHGALGAREGLPGVLSAGEALGETEAVGVRQQAVGSRGRARVDKPPVAPGKTCAGGE